MIALLLSAIAWLCTMPAHADPAVVSASVGQSITAAHRWTHVAFIDLTTSTRDFDDVHWQPAYTLGWVDSRSVQNRAFNHTVYVGAAGVRLVDWWRRAFFSIQFGAADGRTAALSSGAQFVSSLGWQDRHWQVMLRHVSNGRLFGGKNYGETMLLVGVRL